jgi:hypothetical protein
MAVKKGIKILFHPLRWTVRDSKLLGSRPSPTQREREKGVGSASYLLLASMAS